jgi:hypothetical protein
MNIEYIPKVDEYLEAYTLYDSKTTQRKIDKIFALIIFILGIFLILISIIDGFTTSNIIFSILFIIFGIFSFFGIFDLSKIIVKIQFKNNMKLKHLQKVRFTENGIEYETEGIKSNIDWNFYKEYYEGKDIFLLVYGKKQYSVIPKYVFKDELDNFRRILEKNIK